MTPHSSFPLEALPHTMRNAVHRAATEIQVPVEMAAASMLGALSLACQDLVNVRRPNGLDGPVSLYFLTIAESGDRKTTCDRLFTNSILSQEDVNRQTIQKERLAFKAQHKAWSLINHAYEQELQKLARKEVKNA